MIFRYHNASLRPRYGRIAPLQNENENTPQELEDENSNNDVSGNNRNDGGEDKETMKRLPKRLFRSTSRVSDVQNYKDQEKHEVFLFFH